MKTLINKENPAIRITSPEIKIEELPHDYYAFFSKKDWTLVEQEQEQPEKNEESKHTEVWVEGRTIFEQDAKKPEVDLERNAVQFCFDKGLNVTPYQAKMIASHFYELGQREMRNRISFPEYNKQVVDKMKSEYPELGRKGGSK